MKYLAIRIKKIRKHITAFVMLCLLNCFLWMMFNTAYVYALEMTGTEILSIIPFIERDEDGIRRNVPIESWEDVRDQNTRHTQLRIQIRVSAEDAERFHGESLFIHRLRTFEPVTAVRAENMATSFEIRNDTEFTHVEFILSDLSNLNSGEIYNKFVIAARDGDGFVPISSARYIDNINHLANRNDTPPVARSIKGLTSIQLPGEARLLGVQHTTVTMILNDIMAAEPGINTETLMFGGEEFFFNMDVISEYDRLISYFTNEGIKVTAMLVISANDYVHPSQREDSTLLPIDHMIHRGALENPSVSPFNFGINTADEYGFKYFAALMSFIADRYVRSNLGNGRIYNVILGNNIGNIFMNYCGPIDIEQYVQDYLRALRIADTAMRSLFGGARVYVPFDNWFAEKPDGDDGFVNRDIIDLLSQFSAAEGNFPWNVAVNAFNADISNLRAWTESEPTHEFDTPFITTRNIEILRDYLNVVLRDYQYSGQPRMIMLANQGFSSGGSAMGIEGDELQAASFVYAYVRARAIPEITAFIYHSQMDNPREELGYFGLRTESGEPKLIRDVFRDMDTNKEYRHLPFAKTLIGIEGLSEIMPRNTELLDTAPAVILTEAVGQSNRAHMNFSNIGRFNNAALDGFIGSINMSDISFEEYTNEDSEFSQGLAVRFTAPRRGDFGSISRIFEPENYLNLSQSNFVGVNIRIDSDLNLYENHSVPIVLTLESSPDHLGSTHIYEGIARIRLNEDTTVFFDISGWEARENIQRLSLAANPYAHEYNYVGSGYHFLMLVESIVGANVSRMTIVQIIIRIIWITALVLFVLWLILFIRAWVIKIRRRKRKQQQQRRRQAMKRQSHGKLTLPSGNSLQQRHGKNNSQ